MPYATLRHYGHFRFAFASYALFMRRRGFPASRLMRHTYAIRYADAIVLRRHDDADKRYYAFMSHMMPRYSRHKISPIHA